MSKWYSKHSKAELAEHIEELEAKLAKAEEQNKLLGDLIHKRGNEIAFLKSQLKKAEKDKTNE